MEKKRMLNSRRGLNNPIARNVMNKVSTGDTAGINKIAENLMESNAGDPRVQQMRAFYEAGDVNGLLKFLSQR